MRVSGRLRHGVTCVALTTLIIGLSACGDSVDSPESAADATYLVPTEFGEIEVPKDYKRVVVTMTALLDSSMAVGVTPVAAPMSFSGAPEYLDLETEDLTSLGDSDGEIDPETLASLEPDLILMNTTRGAEPDSTMYSDYTEIAPTVPIITGEQDPKGVAAQVGVALDRTNKMDKAASHYEKRATRLKKQLADDPQADMPVSQVRLQADHVRVMMEDTNAGVAMTDVGLTFAPPVKDSNVGDGGYYESSLEMLPGALGEHIFVYSTEEGVVEDVEDSPIWRSITAVEQGRAHFVDFEAWMRGQGYLALEQVLEDIAAAYGKSI